jgi:hypothetical protein
MRHALVFLTVLGSGAGALGQDRPGAGEILIDASGPDAHHERRSVPLPPEGPEREAFLREFLVVDLHENSVREASAPFRIGVLHPGGAHRPRSPGRGSDPPAHLVDGRRRARWTVASVVAGVLVMSSAKNVNSPSCSTDVFAHNACVDSHKSTTTAGALILVAGVALGTGLFTWAR